MPSCHSEKDLSDGTLPVPGMTPYLSHGLQSKGRMLLVVGERSFRNTCPEESNSRDSSSREVSLPQRQVSADKVTDTGSPRSRGHSWMSRPYKCSVQQIHESFTSITEGRRDVSQNEIVAGTQAATLRDQNCFTPHAAAQQTRVRPARPPHAPHPPPPPPYPEP